MLFNSLHYILFFPAAVVLFFTLPRRWRNLFLLAASYYFYMCWKMEYILLIVASTLIDYTAGLRMSALTEKGPRKKWLVLSLMSNLGLLFAFKYFNFFNDSARAVFERFDITYGVAAFDVLLPVGISFYTFQTLSYTIEVYRGRQEPERNLTTFALYVSFFPQLVAGPIERSMNLLPQFHRNVSFDAERVRRGLQLIMWGMFKKVVIADRAAVIVNTIYNDPGAHGGIEYLIATFFFAYQIYCDFSGYSDIAIGSAQVLGFDLMRNFDRPYYSKSISEFWKRWHISLSSWFRDYLYVPLGGNRVGKSRWYFNLFATFLVSGLWHGANWTFVIWGGLNGLYLIGEVLTAGLKARSLAAFRLDESSWWYKVPAAAWTFALTCLAWVFFRANSVGDAFHIVGHLGDGLGESLGRVLSLDTTYVYGLMRGLGLGREDLVVLLLAIVALETVQWQQRGGSGRDILASKPVALRWAFYYALLGAVVFLGAYNQAQQFIYFQF